MTGGIHDPIGAMNTALNEPIGAFETAPLSQHLGLEVTGLDLSGLASDPLKQQIVDLFHRSAVLVIRDQDLSPEQLIAFSRLFGDLEPHTDFEHLLPGHDAIMAVGNVDIGEGRHAFFHNAKEEWHTDLVQTRTPNSATVLYAIESPPEGAETRFADARRAFDALPDAERARLSRLTCVYDIKTYDDEMRRQDPRRPALSEEKIRLNPPVSHPLVRTHPVTGVKSLYFAPEIISHVDGMTRAETKTLVYKLLAHLTEPEFVYEHRWRDGDVVIWDNRCTLHTATPFDATKYRRLLYRTVISGQVPV